VLYLISRSLFLGSLCMLEIRYLAPALPFLEVTLPPMIARAVWRSQLKGQPERPPAVMNSPWFRRMARVGAGATRLLWWPGVSSPQGQDRLCLGRSRNDSTGDAVASPPAVSVIVPIYNKAHFLAECLDSIRQQTLAEIEILCVDDCSTDASPHVLAEHARADERIVTLRTPRNLGPGGARNLGLEHARGDYVQFTDADDLLPLQALRTLYELACATGDLVVRGSLGNTSEGEEGVWSNEEHRMADRTRLRLLDEPKLWIPYFHVCYMYSRAFLAANHITYPALRSGEDPVFLASCLLRTPSISTSSAITYVYRRSGSSHAERRTFEHLMDFLVHVATLKAMFYAADHRAFWSGRCEAFFLDDTIRLARTVPLDPRQRSQVLRAMREIWGLATEDLAGRIRP
jgi:glycosyltransferase involved in cell wall biosynthesis